MNGKTMLSAVILVATAFPATVARAESAPAPKPEMTT
jgi:hypothetical protein